MGRPIASRQAAGIVQRKSSTSDLKTNTKKTKKKHFYQTKSFVGSSKQGHGFAVSNKNRLLKKFRKKIQRKKKAVDVVTQPKPLAEDLQRIPQLNLSEDLQRTPQLNLSEDLQRTPQLNLSEDNTLNITQAESLGDDSCQISQLKSLTDDSWQTCIDESVASTVSVPSSITEKKRKSKTKDLKRIEIDYHLIQEERKRKFQELEASVMQHEKSVLKNIEKRKKLTKRLAKKTKRGQPLMANRLEHLLEKIKNSGTK